MTTYRCSGSILKRAAWVACGGVVLVFLFWAKTRERPDIFQHWLVLVGLIAAFGLLILGSILIAVHNVSVTLQEDRVSWTTFTGAKGECSYGALTIKELRTSAGLCYRIGARGGPHFTISDMIAKHDELMEALEDRAGPDAWID